MKTVSNGCFLDAVVNIQHDKSLYKKYIKKQQNENRNETRIFMNGYEHIYIFPIFLKIFVDLFPDYMKPFHHKYVRLLGSDDFYSCLRLLHQLYKQTPVL